MMKKHLLPLLLFAELAVGKSIIPRPVERYFRAYVSQVEEFYRQGKYIKPLIAGTVLSAGLLVSGHFFYRQDFTDRAVADRVALEQLADNTDAVRFVLPNGNEALGRIVGQNSLHHVEVLPFITYRPQINFIDYPVNYRPWFASETPLKINVDNIAGKIVSPHADFRKRVTVTVGRGVVGLKDRYYVNDWLELHSTLIQENLLAKQLIGRVFAVFDDGFYGILLFEVQDKNNEIYPLEEKTIVFATLDSLTFL